MTSNGVGKSIHTMPIPMLLKAVCFPIRSNPFEPAPSFEEPSISPIKRQVKVQWPQHVRAWNSFRGHPNVFKISHFPELKGW